MVQEGLFLFSELRFLLRSELTLILVVLNSDELSVANLNLFVKQELYLDLGQVDVRLALSDDEIGVLLRVPFFFDTQSGCIVRDLY